MAGAEQQADTVVLGVVGAGLMGRGIAQVAAQAGIAVRLHDARPGGAQEGVAFVRDALERRVQQGGLSRAQADAALGCLQPVDTLAQLASCTMVIEAIVESLAAKQQLLQALEDTVSDSCLLATNTSSLLVTEVAAACRRPQRVGGLHFFSPVPRMKVTEVILGARSEPRVGTALEAFSRRIGHEPVRAQDTPGFIVNHAGRAYGPESVRIASENIADFQTIDRILREACGFRMGPFELFDLTGLDVSHPAGESIYHQFYEEPRFKPSLLLRTRLAAGLLGRKSGGGFYGPGREAVALPVASAAPALQAAAAGPVWLSAPDASRHAAVQEALRASGAVLETAERPSPAALCLVLPIGQDATMAALANGLDPARTVAVDPLFFSGRCRTLMTSPATQAVFTQRARAVFGQDGTPVCVLRDSPGFVAQRVVAAIVNIGCDMAQQGIASPHDIDRAVTLALGYPRGPFAMGDALGAATVLQILEGLHARYQEPRYRASPWLSRRAALGLSLFTVEG